MQFVLDNSPSWVDICGLILSFLSLIAAGTAAWKLLARDKQRENEVDALIKMASHYEKMFELESNKTKPRFVLESYVTDKDEIRIILRNVGGTVTIQSLNTERNTFIHLNVEILKKTLLTNEPLMLVLTKAKSYVAKGINFRLYGVVRHHIVTNQDFFVLVTEDAFAHKFMQTAQISLSENEVLSVQIGEPINIDYNYEFEQVT